MEGGRASPQQGVDRPHSAAAERSLPGMKSPQQGVDRPHSAAAEELHPSPCVAPAPTSSVSDQTSPTANPAAIAHSEEGCMFIPGRVEGKPVSFLVDTGCTNSLMAKALFDRLPARVREKLEPYDTSASMADGSGLPIYGRIHLKGRLRNYQFKEDFLVSQISYDLILGMTFLRSNECTLSCDKGILVMQEESIPCTNRQGTLLANRVQVLRTTPVPPNTEMQILCRLNSTPSRPTGIIENIMKADTGLAMATTLSKPSKKGHVMIRCLNVTDETVELRAGGIVGLYQPVEEEQIFSKPVETEPARELPQPTDGESPHTRLHSVPSHLEGLYRSALETCREELQQTQIARLLTEYQDVFSRGEADMGQTDLVEHSIPLLPDSAPIRQPPRRLGVEKDAEVERQVSKLLEQDLVEPADSAWSSPVVLVRKKDGSWRLCIDYRRVNAVTRRDAYPLPRIDDSLDALTGSAYFSTLDLLSGYWQVPLDTDAQEKSAFVTRGGLWKWKVLPFGLTSAPATFERLMERVLKGLQWKTLLLYLDDVIVFSTDFDSHLERLQSVLSRFRQAKLKLKPEKCDLFQRQVTYLGHVVSQAGVATDPEKVEAVRTWPTPRNLREVRAFLGFVGYYRRFVPDFATTAKPLTRLTKKENPFVWTEMEHQAFHQLRHLMMTAPVLAYPDPSRPYILDTDASLDGAGAVLSQIHQEQERVVAYYSKTFKSAERNYCVTRRELLAAVLAVGHFRPYLYGAQFRLRTDHASLLWLYRRTEPSHQIARWLELFAEFNFKMEHRPGVRHGNADGLSRRCRDCQQCERIEKRDASVHPTSPAEQEHPEKRDASVHPTSPAGQEHPEKRDASVHLELQPST